jgi:hypothetical protein
MVRQSEYASGGHISSYQPAPREGCFTLCRDRFRCMSSPAAVPPAKSAKGWFWAMGIVLAVGAIAAAVLGVQAAGALPERPVTLNPGQNTIRLEKEGVTLFSSEMVTGAECTVTTGDGKAVPMEDPAGTERYEFDSGAWYVSRRSVDPVPPGQVVISCPEAEATFAYGPRNTIVKFALLLVGAIGIGVAAFGIAVILLIVGLVKRSRNRRQQFQPPPA